MPAVLRISSYCFGATIGAIVGFLFDILKLPSEQSRSVDYAMAALLLSVAVGASLELCRYTYLVIRRAAERKSTVDLP